MGRLAYLGDLNDLDQESTDETSSSDGSEIEVVSVSDGEAILIHSSSVTSSDGFSFSHGDRPSGWHRSRSQQENDHQTNQKSVPNRRKLDPNWPKSFPNPSKICPKSILGASWGDPGAVQVPSWPQDGSKSQHKPT